MNAKDFADEVIIELKKLDIEHVEDKGAIQALANKAVATVKSKHSEEEIHALFDPNRELTQEELTAISGGGMFEDTLQFVGKEVGKYLGDAVQDAIEIAAVVI